MKAASCSSCPVVFKILETETRGRKLTICNKLVQVVCNLLDNNIWPAMLIGWIAQQGKHDLLRNHGQLLQKRVTEISNRDLKYIYHFQQYEISREDDVITKNIKEEVAIDCSGTYHCLDVVIGQGHIAQLHKVNSLLLELRQWFGCLERNTEFVNSPSAKLRRAQTETTSPADLPLTAPCPLKK